MSHTMNQVQRQPFFIMAFSFWDVPSMSITWTSLVLSAVDLRKSQCNLSPYIVYSWTGSKCLHAVVINVLIVTCLQTMVTLTKALGLVLIISSTRQVLLTDSSVYVVVTTLWSYEVSFNESLFFRTFLSSQPFFAGTEGGHWGSSLRVVTEGGHWGWALRVVTEGGHWGWSLRVVTEGGHWGWSLRVVTEGGHWGWSLRVVTEGGHWGWSLPGRLSNSVDILHPKLRQDHD